MVKVRSRFLRPMFEAGDAVVVSVAASMAGVSIVTIFLRSAFQDVEMRQEGDESVLRLSK